MLSLAVLYAAVFSTSAKIDWKRNYPPPPCSARTDTYQSAQNSRVSSRARHTTQKNDTDLSRSSTLRLDTVVQTIDTYIEHTSLHIRHCSVDHSSSILIQPLLTWSTVCSTAASPPLLGQSRAGQPSPPVSGAACIRRVRCRALRRLGSEGQLLRPGAAVSWRPSTRGRRRCHLWRRRRSAGPQSIRTPPARPFTEQEK